jgi:hypothetical protein
MPGLVLAEALKPSPVRTLRGRALGCPFESLGDPFYRRGEVAGFRMGDGEGGEVGGPFPPGRLAGPVSPEILDESPRFVNRIHDGRMTREHDPM